jgi:hypothetical protein
MLIMELVYTSETSATPPIPSRCNCLGTTRGELREHQNVLPGTTVLS